MSRLNKRVILSVLISLGVILAIFTSVQGAAPEAAASKVGTHLVSGAQVNLNHDRFTSAELDAYKAQLDSMKGRGGCESEFHFDPDL